MDLIGHLPDDTLGFGGDAGNMDDDGYDFTGNADEANSNHGDVSVDENYDYFEQPILPHRQERTRYSPDVRKLMIYQLVELGLTTEEIASYLDANIRSVQHILKQWRDFGRIISDPVRGGTGLKLKAEHIRVRCSLSRARFL